MFLPRFVLLAALSASALAADDLKVDPKDLPRFPAVEPEQAVATWQVKPGFHVELVAAEPNVASPIAVTFDENGRMFVLEMRDYPEQRDETPHLGRVRMLEDTKGDGHYDRATIFADDLAWPTGLIWANGGLFVITVPDVIWLKDTKGAGRADLREVVYTGFNADAPKLNVQALPNCFQWGPDNRIHLQTGGGNRGTIRSPKLPYVPGVALAGRDFWFDPVTYRFGFEAGGGQYGMSYDNEGRKFVCNNSDHLRTYLFDSSYGRRNPYYLLPSPLASIAADGPAAEVFRVSPDEPWRVIRTRWRVSGRVPGVVEGGGRVSGYFTGATGTIVYRGDAFPSDFLDNTFTGDAGGGLVHHKRLRPNGVSLIGERPPDEQKIEFAASRDTWCRPVNFANTPDGTLFIIDMYREVIEHPWSIPEQIKVLLDLTSGRERGRIYRLAPDGFKPKPPPHLGSATTAELVQTLAHPNGWTRDTATRLLCERRDPASGPLLEKMMAESPAPLGRLHALRALDGTEQLTKALLLKALADSDPAVREHAIRLCEQTFIIKEGGRLAPNALWQKLSSMADDPAPRVRLQLAFTAGDCVNEKRASVLAAIAANSAADPWITAAIFSAPPEAAIDVFSALSRVSGFADTTAGATVLARLAFIIGARNAIGEASAAFEFASGDSRRISLLAALAEGLSRAGSSLAKIDDRRRIPVIYEKSRVAVGDASLPTGVRTSAARLLAFDLVPETRAVLLAAVDSKNPAPLISAALDGLARWPDAAVTAELLQHWNQFDVALRTEVVRFLAARPARAQTLLGAIQAGKIPAAEIATSEVRLLQDSRDKQVAALANTLLPKPASGSRDDVIHHYEPALLLTGNKAKGHEIFAQRCIICHRLRGEGNAFGPDLESVVTGGKEKLLTAVLDPNREVAPQYAAYTVELKDGGAMAGILAAESAAQVVVREPLGKETSIPRDKIARMQTTGRSPMPDGLEAGLEMQDVANLLEFLTSGSK